MIYFCVVFLLFAIDFLSKETVLRFLKFSKKISFGLINLTYVENSGAAFGFFKGQKIFLSLLSITAIFLLSYHIIKKKSKLRTIETVIISGILGNLFDRLFRGYIIDFIELSFVKFPVFNLADIFIIVGSVFLFFYLY
ncbi:MAG: signal peptidase II [Clostridiales bacterium]|jgi:signal peptidase II|nr:signal peptidase II [Clostridiales bacterium]